MLISSLMLGFPYTAATAPGVEQAETREPYNVGRFIKEEWSVVRSTREVEPCILSAVAQRFLGDSRFADRDEPFQATDIDVGLPRRRLVLAGRGQDRWFIVYERGGLGHHLVFVVLDARVRVPRILMFARGYAGEHNDLKGWHLDLQGLRAALREGRLKVEAPDDRYW